MMEQGKYAQDADILVSNNIMDCLIRNFMANPIKEEKFVEKNNIYGKIWLSKFLMQK